jgi:hypothetical protein
MAFTKKPAAGAKPAAKKSRYAGINAASPRDPIPEAGEYRLRVIDIQEGYNEGAGTTSYKPTFEIVATSGPHKEGASVLIPWVVDGAKNAKANRERVKAFVMAAAGYEDEEEYNAFESDGEFIDSTAGAANDYSGVATLIGRLVDVEVRKGNDVVKDDKPTGDYYREYAWVVVPEEEQDQAPKAEL